MLPCFSCIRVEIGPAMARLLRFVPAGEQTVKVTLGEAEISETFSLKAGETVEKNDCCRCCVATVNAYYAEGMKVEASGLGVEIFEAKQDINGNRKSIAYSYGPDKQFTLPPGDYLSSSNKKGRMAKRLSPSRPVMPSRLMWY